MSFSSNTLRVVNIERRLVVKDLLVKVNVKSKQRQHAPWFGEHAIIQSKYQVTYNLYLLRYPPGDKSKHERKEARRECHYVDNREAIIQMAEKVHVSLSKLFNSMP
jgi:hypothetical protein